MSARMHARLHACQSAKAHVCTHVKAHVKAHVYTHVDAHVCTHVDVHVTRWMAHTILRAHDGVGHCAHSAMHFFSLGACRRQMPRVQRVHGTTATRAGAALQYQWLLVGSLVVTSYSSLNNSESRRVSRAALHRPRLQFAVVHYNNQQLVGCYLLTCYRLQLER